MRCIVCEVAVVSLASLIGLWPGAAPGARAPEERAPAVAGSFYPADPVALRESVRAFLDDALPPRPERPIALVAPHAGYVFSGQIAADAWRQAQGRDYDILVILGTNHTVPAFDGVAVSDFAGYRTPLGLARIDREVASALRKEDAKRFAARPDAEAREHSIEVQVPFAQLACPGVEIVAAVVGEPDSALCARFGEALAKVLQGRRPLIVASSDLAHYPAYEDAVASDAAVLAAVAAMEPESVRRAVDQEMRRGRTALETCACGEGPILAALEAAKRLGATRATVVSCANSGDTSAGERSRVVGYGAVALTTGKGPSDMSVLQRAAPKSRPSPAKAEEGKALLAFARTTLERAVRMGTFPLARDVAPEEDRRQGAFVTLWKNRELRGCIGHWEADLPRGQVVGAMTLKAAFNDPRFSPVREEELSAIEIEISLLTPFERVQSASELELGRHGVYLAKNGRAAIFLPEVAGEQGWSREQLMDHLCLKAGLANGDWRSGAEIYRFETTVFREGDRGGAGHRS